MRRNALMLAALAALTWIGGCSDKDPVSAQNEGPADPAGKLVVTKQKAGGFPLNGSSLSPRVPRPNGITTLTASLPGGEKMVFVKIEPGTFTMGSEPGLDNGEAYHQVTLTKGFYLGRYEITQGQWEAVMGIKPWSGDNNPVQEAPNNPAVDISWYDVQEFIHKLNQAAGDSLYRLPTEAEWEYAARAGTTTTWSFGDDESPLGNYAWYDNTLHAVGTKRPNPWGLYGMHGNADEWVQDWYEPYSSNAQIDPKGPASGSDHVRRGDLFCHCSWGTMSASRSTSNALYYGLGARLVRIK